MTSTPESAFIASILSQAYTDMLGPNDDHAFPAISFLTTRYGQHARWRGKLCSLLGFDGDLVARRIIKGLEGEIPLHPMTIESAPSETHTKGVERARQRWQHLKHNAAPPVSSV